NSVTVAGPWTNNDTFTARSGTVTFDGTDQSISGSSTFFNFTKIEGVNDATDETLTFDNTATQTISNLLTLNGRDADDRINLVSDSPGTPWGLTANGTFAIDFVEPTDSDASGGSTIQHTDTANGGNNLNWNLGVSITGTVYTDEGTTNIGSGKTVAISVNGAAAAATDDTDANGVYSLGEVTINSGDVVTLYLDGETEKAVTVTIGSGDGMSGLDLYRNRLITRHDYAFYLTNSDLDTADNNGEADITAIYSVVAGALTVNDSYELYIPTTFAFAPGNTVTADDIDINGTFTMAVNAVTVSGTWDATGGTVTSTTNTVTFDAASGTETITSNANSFYNLTINDAAGTATFELQDALSVSNNLTIADGILDTKDTFNYSITVGNDYAQTGGQCEARSSTITVAGDFTADGTDDSTDYNTASLVFTGTGGLTYNNLTSNWANGFYNLNTGDNGNTTTLNGTLAVLNILTVGSGIFTGNFNIFLSNSNGDVLSFDTNSTISVDTLRFHGTTQNIPTLTNGYDCGIVLNGDGVTVTQTGDIVINSTNAFIVHGDGLVNRISTYETAGYDLTVGGFVQIGAGEDTGLKTLDASGGSTVTIGGNLDIRDVGAGSQQAVFITTGSTVIFNGSTAATVQSMGSSFNDVTINKTAAIVTLEDAFDVDGALIITSGTLDVKNGENNAINVAGNWSNSDTFTARNSLVTFEASSGTVDILSGGSAFYDVVFNDGGGGVTFELEDAFEADGALTITGGTVDTKSGEN
ncbi:MAG: hypothetical protein K8S27_12255, partial [Candidatus Omnitrophica bacterium]|nr:hypothetical protein [Candidatus Omnitrophota bacterium]